MKHSRPPDLKSSWNVSLPFAWITGPCKRTQLNQLLMDGPLESRLASYNVTTSLQLVMKKENSSSPGENHQIQPLSRKTSNLNHPGRGSSVPGSLTMAGDQQKVAVFYSLYYVMSKSGRFLKKDIQSFLCQARNSILLHSDLNLNWHFWLSTRFFCCLKIIKSVRKWMLLFYNCYKTVS